MLFKIIIVVLIVLGILMDCAIFYVHQMNKKKVKQKIKILKKSLNYQLSISKTLRDSIIDTNDTLNKLTNRTSNTLRLLSYLSNPTHPVTELFKTLAWKLIAGNTPLKQFNPTTIRLANEEIYITKAKHNEGEVEYCLLDAPLGTPIFLTEIEQPCVKLFIKDFKLHIDEPNGTTSDTINTKEEGGAK